MEFLIGLQLENLYLVGWELTFSGEGIKFGGAESTEGWGGGHFSRWRGNEQTFSWWGETPPPIPRVLKTLLVVNQKR